ncbi:auxin-responsive protein IAA28-like [Nicotiana sylvestris]|uniref:Auxin-responsive protein n=1 Tax=Nicotiana sylvestris TaxID=4096 RepID=A0A1U7YEA8_NICSY|nr:PREDICTED: auxin-responsive protein IAA29-like [Nicotiana sylvestris]
MELELGLALPYNNFPTNIKGLGQNGIARFEPKEMKMMMRKDSFGDNFSEVKQKRSFAEAFENGSEGVERKTLSLLIWDGQPNEEGEDNGDDDHHGRKQIPFKACDDDSEEENQVVGWPPINIWRKKQFHGNYNHGWWITNERKPMYVKVKMEGVAIGRKVNLMLYDSYQVLNHNLIQMFAKYLNLDNHTTCFTILYQDKDGDWMLAGDVPWQTFMESVQRIEIQRNEK